MARTRKRKAPRGVVTVESRQLITLHDGDSLRIPDGALVRYIHTAGLGAEEAQRRARQILEAGAAACRVGTPDRVDEAQVMEDETPAPEFAAVDVREAAEQLIVRTKNVDQDQLRQVVEQALTEVGL